LHREEFISLFLTIAFAVLDEYGQALLRSCCPPRPAANEFDGQIGEGGFGAVFVGRDQATRARRAVKRVPLELAGPPGAVTESDFLRLLDHPNIVKLHDHYTDFENHYLVMESAR